MGVLLEPYPVPDVYADGIDHIENLGNVCRVVFFTYARGGGLTERLVVAKIIRPVNSLLSKRELRDLIDRDPILGMLPERLRNGTH